MFGLDGEVQVFVMYEFVELCIGVVVVVFEFFSIQGFDQILVEQIVKVVGVFWLIFFWQFGGKEDVVFVDYEVFLEQLWEFLVEGYDDLWGVVCVVFELVFVYFVYDLEFVCCCYQIVCQVFVLCECEIIMVFCYECFFDDYLCGVFLGVDLLDVVGFVVFVMVVYNYVLCQFLCGWKKVLLVMFQIVLVDVCCCYGVVEDVVFDVLDDVVVVVFFCLMLFVEVICCLCFQFD